MITYFTTTKDFIGKTKIAQINAIQSWLESVDQAEVIVFGESNGVEELAEEIGFIHKPEVRVSEQGTPYINDMFHQTAQLARHKICCFVNADIIVYKKFAESLLAAHSLLKEKYLLVGQRQNISLDTRIMFDGNWESTLRQQVAQRGETHPPVGIDFFAFPRGQYHERNMPDLLVGRGGWDLWMIYNARKRAFKVTDLSPTTMVVHQDHDYSHRATVFSNYADDEEAVLNLSHLPAGETYNYTLFACNYSFKNGRLRRNFARWKLRTFIRYELNLRRHNALYRAIKSMLQKIRILPMES